MKATVTDPDLLKAINPAFAVAYLKSNGWNLSAVVADRFSVWHTPKDEESEILIPLRTVAPDFASVMGRALKQLENLEGRSQVSIMRDLMNSGFDIIRIASHSPATKDGSVRVEDGLQIFENTREILLASACAAVQPRPVYHSRKPPQAVEFVRKARFGQTEVGSFVLTVLAPIAPSMRATDLFGNELDQPFERSVTETLGNALKTMVSAAETTSLLGFKVFQDAVQNGVSANLCEAAADLLKADEASSLKIDISWALNRPRPSIAPIFIPQSVVGSLEEAARSFRAKDTLEDYQVQGPVVKLQHEMGESHGKVTILADVEGQARRVGAILPLELYNKAVEAHGSYRPVRLSGDLVKEGRSYALNSPSRLDVLTDEDLGAFD